MRKSLLAAGMADYIDALHKRHFSDDVKPYIRAERIHTLQRNYEREICAPLIEFLSSRNDIKLLGPKDNYQEGTNNSFRCRGQGSKHC